MKRCILVICVNSLMSSDYEIIKELDNFKYVISQGAVVKRVKNQYPNLNKPVSATILTGESPFKHGIYSDNCDILVRRYREKEYDDIHVNSILDLFKSNKNKVSTIYWPNMGYSSFKYNFSNIENIRDVFRGIVKGSSFYMLKNMIKYSDVIKLDMQPDLDNFSSILAMELLEKNKSNVIFLTLNHLDYIRKRYGFNRDRDLEALISIDKKIGDIISWCDNKGVLDGLTLSLVSGGGPYEGKHRININHLFLKNNMILVNKKGKIIDYLCYAHCEGGSALIYLKDINNINDYGKVKVLLEDFINTNGQYIKNIYETIDYEKFDLNNFCFRLEAQSNCIFDGGLNKTECIENIESSVHTSSKVDKCFYGYCGNSINSNGLFINYGYKINKGVEVEACNLIDIAPTIASFMDLEFKCSGNIIREILEE